LSVWALTDGALSITAAAAAVPWTTCRRLIRSNREVL
jgi:hypothetical protein